MELRTIEKEILPDAPTETYKGGNYSFKKRITSSQQYSKFDAHLERQTSAFQCEALVFGGIGRASQILNRHKNGHKIRKISGGSRLRNGKMYG